MAMEHLIGRGLRHFGTLQYRGDKLRHVMFKEFRERVKAEGMDYSERLLPVGFFDRHQKWQAGQQIIKEWIETWELPIGVLCQYDDFAQALLDVAMSRYGISIPHDLALIGCGNELPLCVRPDIKLTSIDMNYQLVGYTAAKLLDSLMSGAEPPAEPITIEPVGLIARQSTDVLAVEDPVVARALRFIAENCHRRIQVRHVAEAASASLRSLQRSFQEAIGRSISDQIEHLRVERAKRLLAESRKTAKELARECGFGGYDHFYEVFKRREGLAPVQYRKQRRAEMA